MENMSLGERLALHQRQRAEAARAQSMLQNAAEESLSTSEKKALREERAREKAIETAADLLRKEELNAHRIYKLTVVKCFFDQARSQFTEDILAGHAITDFVLTDVTGPHHEVGEILGAANWNLKKERPNDNPRHPYHGLWLEFAYWAAANGLEAVLGYAKVNEHWERSLSVRSKLD